jgi:DNA-binding CsgD family transcriptional regulator
MNPMEAEALSRAIKSMAFSLVRIEAKLDLLLNPPPSEDTDPHDDFLILSSFTTRQHAIIQMMLRDATVDEIADRLSVSTNTIKTHISLIVKKSGSERKSHAISRLSAVVGRSSPEIYAKASGGLPKDWDSKWPNVVWPGADTPVKPKTIKKGTSHAT